MSSDAELISTLQTMQKSLKRALEGYRTLAKALERMDREAALERQDYLSDAVAAIRAADLSVLGCADQKRVENKAHMKMVSDNPLVVYIHPLTLEVNFEAAKCTWTYAHETLSTVSLAPEEIMAEHAHLVDAFRAARIDSAQFFTICHKAYEMALIRAGQKPTERVDIVELLTPMAWLWPETHAGKKGMAQLPRYLMAYQLQKLRSDRMLQQNGLRLDLGAATGGTTRNKSGVLYIPQGASEGQYYLSICFREA